MSTCSLFVGQLFIDCPCVMFIYFKGVLATHKITASSPDTDLPTVHGLRVNIYSKSILKMDLFIF